MPKKERESQSLPATVRPGDFALGSLRSRGAARAILEGEHHGTDYADCLACMLESLPMPEREHPEEKDAHWDEERNVFRFLHFSRAEHKRLGVEHYLKEKGVGSWGRKTQ